MERNFFSPQGNREGGVGITDQEAQSVHAAAESARKVVEQMRIDGLRPAEGDKNGELVGWREDVFGQVYEATTVGPIVVEPMTGKVLPRELKTDVYDVEEVYPWARKETKSYQEEMKEYEISATYRENELDEQPELTKEVLVEEYKDELRRAGITEEETATMTREQVIHAIASAEGFTD